MNELQEILVAVFVAYVIVKGTILWMVHRRMFEIAEEVKQKRAIKRMQDRPMIPEGWTEMWG